MTARFITFEGGEGAGKSTQIALLADYLEDHKEMSVVLTREPGGCASAEAIRSLVLHSDFDTDWQPASEALLMNAARCEHLQQVIIPALKEDKTVLCDRFMDSTMAYQGYGYGQDKAFLKQLQQAVVGQHVPDLTFIFDLDPKIAFQRVQSRTSGELDRIERKDMGFHKRIRDGFLDIAKHEPNRCHVLDASASVEDIHKEIIGVIEARFA